MHLLELTLPAPAENLALDEALLDAAEAAEGPGEVLRFWEPAAAMVVVGRSSRIAAEVRADVCRALGVPVLRRCSGGAAIVAGPGCLLYTLVLRRESLRGETACCGPRSGDGALPPVDRVHRHVLGVLTGALGGLAAGVTCRGTSDLVLDGRKFSGNSLRAKRTHLLYHGTLLYDFPLELIDRCLPMPPRTPDYRAGRPHPAFVVNLPAPGSAIRRAIAAAWQATVSMDDWPRQRTRQLVADRYGQSAWNAQW